jgi:hypothetical protein
VSIMIDHNGILAGPCPTKEDLPVRLLVRADFINVEEAVRDDVLVDRELPRAENLTLQA